MMKQNERSIAFFATLLIVAGVSILNLEQIGFTSNRIAYLSLIAGVFLAIIFFIMRYQNRSKDEEE